MVKTCKSYKNADQEISESILLIETRWLKIQRQLEFLRNIWPSLDEEYQIHQNGVLQLLQGKAQAATSLIDGVIGKPDDEASTRSIMSKKGETRRGKYALSVKSLKSVQDDLKQWSEVFDISWYLLIRESSNFIDQELQKFKPISAGEFEPLSTLKELRNAIRSNLYDPPGSGKKTVFLPENFFRQGEKTVLEYSCSEVWFSTKDNTPYMVDSPSTRSTLSDMCKLAKILQRVRPLDFGIPSCKGLVKTTANEPSSQELYRFVFSFPAPLQPGVSLRSRLLSQSIESQSLDERFALAKELAKAVMFVHSAGFVHKNIRPETILLLKSYSPSSTHKNELPTQHPWTNHAFLTGFETFRLAEGMTVYQGDSEWHKCLYRYPSRQGINPEVLYSMQHDIYSLGVCLLEIGLRISFVTYTNSNPEPGEMIASAMKSDVKDARKKAFELKRALVRMAKEELPQKMGRKFAYIVVTCLTCLDKTENLFGDEKEFLDENGVLVGVRFIEKVSYSQILGMKRGEMFTD